MRRLLAYGLVGAALAVVPGFLWIWRPEAAAKPGVERVLSAQDPQPLPQLADDLKGLNLLLLGYGGAGHEGGSLTDAMILVHVDFDQAKIGLISVPRDIWIDGNKINHLYAANYADLRDAIATVTGQSPNYFVAVDFVGFTRAMGYVLDGIEVEGGQDFDDPWYPTEGKQLDPCGYTPEEIAELTAKYEDFELQKHFQCRYERISFNKGKTYMNGAEALKYVRSRHTSSDFDRSRRQHEVLVGVKNKLFSLNAWDDISKFWGEFTKYVQTDVDLEIARYLAPAIKAGKDYRMISINLSTDNVLKADKSNEAGFTLTPKQSWEQVREYVARQL